MLLTKMIEDRTVTVTGLSIGTGLAMETLFDVEPYDKDRAKPTKVKPSDFKLHVYNIYTLYRNVVGSIKYNEKDRLVADNKVKEQLLNDMYNLITLYDPVDTELVFYLPDYTKIYREYNKGKDGSVYKPYVDYTFMKDNISKLNFPGTVFKGMVKDLLPRGDIRSLLLTSYTVDLVNHYASPGLMLLESHTGKIKNRTEFGTKYKPLGKRDMTHLPMNSKLLYILGDKTLVKPLSTLDRRAIYEISKVKLWSPVMSRSILESHVNAYKNKIPV